ncbi:MAG: 50S ribosomal protein L5 [Patescibacteria group bacterium]
MIKIKVRTKNKTAHGVLPKDLLEKIVVNAGVGRLSQQPNFAEKALQQVKKDIALITGQVPEERSVKRSIAGFKVREGQVVGLRVTLRGKKMVDFFNRLVMIVLPRVRDFRGIDLTAVDQGGVLNIGIREQVVFSEINSEESTLVFPLQVNIVPRDKHRDAAIEIYRRFGVPLKK